MQSNIKVAVRIRNMENIDIPYTYTDDNIKANNANFKFDKVFGPNTQNKQIFDELITEQISIFQQGYSSTIFVYGQSASGKSYTMLSNSDSIIQLTAKNLLQQTDKRKYTIAVIELYNEQLRDLLDVVNIDLRITQDKKGNVFVEGATKQNLTSESDFQTLLKAVQRNRQVGCTDLNLHSSRSHLIVIIAPGEVDPSNRLGPNINTYNQRNQLFLIDLAGSERVSKTNAKGQTLTEGASINSSLLTLGRVIQAVIERRQYIPFRDSKLTRIIQPALGNSASCQLIVCVSPQLSNLDETIQSLRFGVRCSNVVNLLQKQMAQKTGQNNESLRAENEELRAQLMLREEEANDLRNIITELESKYQTLRMKSKDLVNEVMGENKLMQGKLEAEITKMMAEVNIFEEKIKNMNLNINIKLEKSHKGKSLDNLDETSLSESSGSHKQDNLSQDNHKMMRIRFKNL